MVKLSSILTKFLNMYTNSTDCQMALVPSKMRKVFDKNPLDYPSVHKHYLFESEVKNIFLLITKNRTFHNENYQTANYSRMYLVDCRFDQVVFVELQNYHFQNANILKNISESEYKINQQLKHISDILKIMTTIRDKGFTEIVNEVLNDVFLKLNLKKNYYIWSSSYNNLTISETSNLRYTLEISLENFYLNYDYNSIREAEGFRYTKTEDGLRVEIQSAGCKFKNKFFK